MKGFVAWAGAAAPFAVLYLTNNPPKTLNDWAVFAVSTFFTGFVGNVAKAVNGAIDRKGGSK